MHGKNDADALLGVGGVVLRRETQGGESGKRETGHRAERHGEEREMKGDEGAGLKREVTEGDR